MSLERWAGEVGGVTVHHAPALSDSPLKEDFAASMIARNSPYEPDK